MGKNRSISSFKSLLSEVWRCSIFLMISIVSSSTILLSAPRTVGVIKTGLHDALLLSTGYQLLVRNARNGPRKADALSANVSNLAIALVAKQQQNNRRYYQQ